MSLLPVDIRPELEELERERRRARRRPWPWALRGEEVVLWSGLTSTGADPQSARILDLGNFNAARIWAVSIAPGTLTFYVDLAYTDVGPWFPWGDPDQPGGRQFTASNPLTLELVTGARYLRVRPAAVTGTWTVLATPYLAVGAVDRPVLPYDRAVENRVWNTGLSLTTTGVKLQYVVPAGKRARVTQAVWDAGGGTTAFQVVPAGAGTPINVASGTALNLSLGLMLQAGDAVQFNVTTAAASGTANGLICYQEVG